MAQANLVILPKSVAYDFLVFCQRNPKPCPLLDVTDPGSARPVLTVKPDSDVDLRSDVPLYRVYRYGKLESEVRDLTELWQDDFVCFLLGCSFSFEEALLRGGVPVRHLDERRPDGSYKNVPMFKTNRPCVRSGMFSGPLVVSMRPMSPADAIRAVEITSRFPRVHGAPVHIGDPELLGIADINKPDFGDSVTVRPGEVPVFWACGVTPQAVALESKPPIMITHAPVRIAVQAVCVTILNDVFVPVSLAGLHVYHGREQ